MDRRLTLKGLAGGLFDRLREAPLLSRFPGPPMLCAGVIARRGDGGTALRAVDGVALRADARQTPFGYDDPFRVASVSKMVTAAGFMRLVGAGRIDLDADISDYLGAKLRHPAFRDTAITSRMVLSHCSGLRNGADFPVPFNRPLLERLNLAAGEDAYGGWFSPPSEAPGLWFTYSDVNFGIAGQIIERVSGERFDRYMHNTLFAPLDLDIGYNWSGVSQRKRDHAAAGARNQGGVWVANVDAKPPPAPAVAFYRAEDDHTSQERDYVQGENGLAFAPHGGLRLSLNDMDKLAAAYCGRHGARIFPASMTRDMMRPAWSFQPDAPNGAAQNGFYQRYGLGVQLPIGRTAPGASPGDAFFGENTSDWRGHFGDAYGWMTGLVWNVRDRRTLVYAINGMPETDRPAASRSALTAPEEAIINHALRSFH